MVSILQLGTPGLSPDSWQLDLGIDAHRIGWKVDVMRVQYSTVDDIVTAARGKDILLWTYTHRYEPRGDALTMLRRIEDAGTKTVGIHLDLYWGIPQREGRIGKNPWWSCQYIYTSDGGERNWSSRGVNHRWLPPAVGLRLVQRAAPSGRYRYIFTGAYAQSVHGDHRAKMLGWARRKWTRDFKWYGASIHGRLHGAPLAAAISYAHAVLGDAAPAPYYWSDRVPRTLCRGAVLAHPRVEGMKGQGIDESNVVLFDRYDFESLGRQLDEMTPQRREELREAGIAVVRERHLWEHRLCSIAEEVL